MSQDLRYHRIQQYTIMRIFIHVANGTSIPHYIGSVLQHHVLKTYVEVEVYVQRSSLHRYVRW
jgi:hypothetical protein